MCRRPGAEPQAPPTLGTLPVVAEHRYRIAAKIRPLLLFWIGKDDVGGARIRWRKGENDARGYDALIGSDPTRAPRKINRWGFILEETGPTGASIVGIMKKSDEETLDEAKSRVAAEAKGSRRLQDDPVRRQPDRGGVEGDRLDGALATTPTASSPRSSTCCSKETAPPKIQKTPMPPGGRTGLLSAVTELLHDGVDTVKRTGRAPGRKGLGYVYYAKQYDLTRVSSSVERNVTYGEVAYPALLKSDFEVRARTESWTESFTIVCGLDGALAEIPVFLTYQPRWWFKVEMVLDERQVF